MTSDGTGIVRRLAAAFGLPMAHHLSARCRTVIVALPKSTSGHVRPRNSEARKRRRREEGPPEARSGPKDGPNLGGGGEVHSNLQALLMALCGLVAPL